MEVILSSAVIAALAAEFPDQLTIIRFNIYYICCLSLLFFRLFSLYKSHQTGPMLSRPHRPLHYSFFNFAPVFFETVAVPGPVLHEGHR